VSRAFLLATFAWAIGLGVAIVVGMLLGVLLPGPAATVASPLLLGLAMGLAHARVLGRASVTRAFVPLTALGATLGWLLGSFVAWRLFVGGHDALAPWANGPVLGLVVGATQSLGLRRSLGSVGVGRSTWTLSSVLVWTAAIGPWLSLSTPASVRIAALAAPGIHAALVALRSALASHEVKSITPS
jgi:hypothetical protein